MQSKGMSYALDHRKVVCKNLNSLRDEKIISLVKVINFLSLFQNRWIDIVAYRGAECNQKESPRVHWILGRLHYSYTSNNRPS